MQNKNILKIVIVTALVLMVPFLAMQFTNEVVWTQSDFVIAGALLLGTGLVYEFFVRNSKHKTILGLVLALTLLIVWADLAVGIFNIAGISGS